MTDEAKNGSSAEKDGSRDGRRVELGEVRKGSFLTSQGDREVPADPGDFGEPQASVEPPSQDDE